MKMFNKVLAIILTVFTLVAALPISALADAWLDVDANTQGSSSKVTVTVDAGVLADILQENGISTDLLGDIKDGVSVDLAALKDAISPEMLLDIIPLDYWVDALRIDVVLEDLGIDGLNQYADLAELLKAVDPAELAALLETVESLENHIEFDALIEDNYLDLGLVASYTDRDALIEKIDYDILKAELATMTTAEILGLVNFKQYVLDTADQMNALVVSLLDTSKTIAALDDLLATAEGAAKLGAYQDAAKLTAALTETCGGMLLPPIQACYNSTTGKWDLAALKAVDMPTEYLIAQDAGVLNPLVSFEDLIADGVLDPTKLLTEDEHAIAGAVKDNISSFKDYIYVNSTTISLLAKSVGGYGEVVKCVDLPKLLTHIDLEKLINDIKAADHLLEDYFHFNTLLHHIDFHELMDAVHIEVVLAQLDKNEVLELVQMIDFKNNLHPVLALVFDKVMMNVDQLTLNGYVVAEEDPISKQLTINARNLVKAIVGTIPTLNDLQSIDGGVLVSMDLGITYAVDGSAPIVQKTRNITFELVLAGNVARLEAAAAKLENLLKRYISISIDGNNIALNVNVPGFVTGLYAKVVNTDKLSDSLKVKLLNLANVSGNDVLAFTDALTLEEIVAILDAVDQDALFNTFKNISYVQVALEKVNAKTGYNLSDVTLDDLLDASANIPSMDRICEVIENKTGRDVKVYIESLTEKADGIIDRVEKISAVQKILDKVGAEFNINVEDISAQDIVDRAMDKPISETISNVIKAKVGVDVKAALENYTVQDFKDKALAKVATMDGYYNKVKNYVDLIASKLPESLMNVSIASLYQGNGSFGTGKGEFKTVSIDAKEKVSAVVEKLLTKLNIDKPEINAVLNRILPGRLTYNVNANAQFKNLYQITYMSRDKSTVLFRAFLPVGADLTVFKNNMDVTGYEFTGWTDVNGVEITKMPAADTVVYADRNKVQITVVDQDNKLLGIAMVDKGDKLADLTNGKLAFVAGELGISEMVADELLHGDFYVGYYTKAGKRLFGATQINEDVTLVAKALPDYYITLDFDAEYTITEDNGAYVLTIDGELPAEFALNLDNAHLLKRANGTDVVSLAVALKNSYEVLKIEDATLAQLYKKSATNVVFNYAQKDGVADAFADSVYATVADAEFYSFSIETDGAAFTAAFADEIRIRVPYSAAVVDNTNQGKLATRVHTTTATGTRDWMKSGVEEIAGEKYVWFDAEHFSDYVIANEYLLNLVITDGKKDIAGSIKNTDVEDVYYPAGAAITLLFDLPAGYEVVADGIEVVYEVDGTPTNEKLDEGDSFTMPEAAVTMTVTVRIGQYFIYYVVNGTVVASQEHTLADREAFAEGTLTEATFLKSFADLTAGVDVAAGYKTTGKWAGFDKEFLGDKNMYVTPKWDLIEYKVVFTDAKTFEGVTVENYETVVVEPAVPAGEIGTVGKWEAYDLSQLATNADATNTYTINADYSTKLSYTVSTDANATIDDADKVVEYGAPVTVTAVQLPGHVATVVVKDAKNNDVTVTDDNKFTMPASNVYVTVVYEAQTLNYTINGEAKTALYGSTVTFTVEVGAGQVLTTKPAGCELVSSVREGGKTVLTYAFELKTDNTAITYKVDNVIVALFKIFNGKLFSGEGDPESAVKNVTFKEWSAAVAGVLSFATFNVNRTQSLLWLWILLAVLLFILLVAVIYVLHIKGKIARPLFLIRFVVWLVGLFFGLCLAVSALGLKIAGLFGRSENPDDYGFENEPAEEKDLPEEAAEEATEEATEEVAEEVAEEATEEVAEEATEEVAEEATEEVAEEATEEVAEEATEEVAEEATEEVAEEATEEVAEEATEEVAEEATEETSDEDEKKNN